MEPIKVMLDEGAFKPVKAHAEDAGFDLMTPVAVTVHRYYPAVVDTGVHVQIPVGYVGMIKSKSGLNVRDGITVEGVIDAGYTGSIKCKLRTDRDEPKHFAVGEKIAQLVIIPIHKCNEMIVTSTLERTERGCNGFGSTGR